MAVMWDEQIKISRVKMRIIGNKIILYIEFTLNK